MLLIPLRIHPAIIVLVSDIARTFSLSVLIHLLRLLSLLPVLLGYPELALVHSLPL